MITESFPDAPVFSESDCSSLASIEVAVAQGSPGVSSFRIHGTAIILKSSCGVLRAVWHFLMPILLFVFPSVSWKILSKLGLPFTHLYPSGSRARRIKNLVVPVHSSERVTPFASVHVSLTTCSETLVILV